MKKIRIALLAVLSVLMTVICCFTAFAEGHEYHLKDLGLSINFPDNMSVATRYDENTALNGDTYLEAKSSDNSLGITVSMLQNEKTQEIYSFSELSYSAMEEYKAEMLKNEQNLDCTDGNYGGVKFLDFSQKYKTSQGEDVYGMQSVALVNGKYIFITSQSTGDSFTSSELKLIKGCLESIRFDHISSSDDGQKAVATVIWIIVILVILALCFVAFSFYMGRKSKNDKNRRRIEEKKRSDYDVLRNADELDRRANRNGGIRGYKTSGDYFENGYDTAGKASSVREQASAKSKGSDKGSPNTFILGLKAIGRVIAEAFVHVGYFFKNLSREIKHSKSKKNTKQKKSSKRSDKRYKKSKDYDVFSDR